MVFKIWIFLQNLIIAFISLGSIIVFWKLLTYKGKNKKCFRKRDKIAFYIRITIKKIKNVGNSIFNVNFKENIFLSVIKSFIKKQDQLSAAKKYEDVSLLVFEEKSPDLTEQESIPPEILYMLNSIRIFSFSEKPDFMKLFKTFETIEIKEGQKLFTYGDPDDSIYVVKNGQIYLLEQDLILNVVNEGDYIASHLSILDVLTDNVGIFKNVSARAKTDCTILRIPTKPLGDLLKQDSEALLRTVQLILVRLQRVIFTALFQYLGLTVKLIGGNKLRLGVKNIEKDNHSSQEFSYSYWLQKAAKGFRIQLNIKDDIKLENYIEIIQCPSNYYLAHENSSENNDLFYILYGSVQILQTTAAKKNNILCVVESGNIIGSLAVLTGDPILFTYKTTMPSCIGIIKKNEVYKILHETPLSVLKLANIISKYLCSFVREIDHALDWINLESGKPLYRQDDPSDYMYILLNGRLRSILSLPDGKMEYVDEYGRGDLVGIVEFLTDTKHCTTVRTVRNSELAKISHGLMEAIKRKYPEVLQRFIYILGNSTLGSLKRTLLGKAYGPKIHNSKYSTVAILAETEDIPLSAFTLELEHALQSIARTLRLTSSFIIKTLGETALDSANEYRFCNWLGHEEDQHTITLYQCDFEFTQWSKCCIFQADYILILALNDKEPILSDIEKQLKFLNIKAQKELIILHKESGDKPLNTSQKLNIHGCNAWHHIRCPLRVFHKKLTSLKKEQSYKKSFENPRSAHCDFSRLARFLTGTSYGLVLGGGGAKGIAHIGVIKAILEADIPIDMVGGVSMGAFVGGLWCQETNIAAVKQKVKDWTEKICHWPSYLFDITFPRTAMFTGSHFNESLRQIFKATQIEDLWLPYFTISTDITNSSMKVHEIGSLWRYIRASMSLSVFIPPICDPQDGHLLLDGGYVNNLPGDIMHKRMEAQKILAIDVGSRNDTDFINYGDSLGIFKMLPLSWTSMKIPNIFEIQSRLAYICCQRQLEQLKKSNYCTYLRPPIESYDTLDFEKFDEIFHVGYDYGIKYFGENKEKYNNKSYGTFYELNLSGKDIHHDLFIDLTQIIHKVHLSKPPSDNSVEGEDSENETI